MTFDKLPFNWFDLLLVVVIALGIRRGRKNGMSEELVGMLTWLAIAVGCAIIYEPLGTALSQSSVFSLLSSFLMVYISAAVLIAVLFTWVKKSLGGKLVGSDVFGSSEFYLGMVAGTVRLSCILIAVLALLNARGYTAAEIKADQKVQMELYGSNFFPSLYEVQGQVFNKSLTGPWIKRQLSFLLIKSTPPEHKEIKRKEFATP
ncbi:MAG: CvpA family protein [Akkermansiaceae bacterium]|nr:CvpA family protein [Verrucomicrobiales bacterium]